MVNTFLLTSSFTQSARLLDIVRLANQRREALQILYNIVKLKIIAKLVDCPLPSPQRWLIPEGSSASEEPPRRALESSGLTPELLRVPSDPYQWYNWIRQVIKLYKSNPYKLYHRMKTDHVSEILVLSQPIEWMVVSELEPETSGILMVFHEHISSDIITFQLCSTSEINDRDKPISFGFIYHPAVLMWLGHEDSLREYLDVHIEISIERGINNQMPRNLHRNAPKPAWCYDDDFHLRHKSNLLNKEIIRSEPTWYQDLPQFDSIPIDLMYFWPFTPKVSNGISDDKKRYLRKE